MSQKNKVMTNNLIGSSETTRESPVSHFNFDDYIKNHQPSHKQINYKGTNQEDYFNKIHLRQRFLEWFLGFIEGDGYFGYYVDGTQKRLQFAIGQTDIVLLQKVRSELGFGKVSSDYSKAKSFRFVVEDQKGIKRIMALLNGNLILPKRRAQFAKWIEAGARFLDENFCLKQDVPKISKENGWLSGFIEAEGCFYAGFTAPSQRSKLSRRLTQKVTVTQQDLFGESSVLLSIGHLFGWDGKLALAKKPNCFRVEMTSKKQQIEIRQYIMEFSLRGKKNIAFERWCRVLERRLNNEHLIEANIPALNRLCKEINQAAKRQIIEKTQERVLFEDSIPICITDTEVA